MNHALSKIIRNKIFYPFWKKLSSLSMYGMNFGVASGYADYSGELYIIQTIKKGLPAGGIVFDIGANVGDWSKFVAKEYKGLDYNLYMFEPSSSAFKQLQQNIENTRATCKFKSPQAASFSS